MRACGGVENDITRDASAAAFDHFFLTDQTRGGGGTYLPWANRPGVAATPTYLPKMRHTHPTLPPKNPKSSVEAACGSKLVATIAKGENRNDF